MSRSADFTAREQSLLVLAPTAKDGEITRSLLTEAGVRCLLCWSLEEVCDELRRGVGAIMLPQEVIESDERSLLVQALADQEPWSDIPILLLTAGGPDSMAAVRGLDLFGNVTLLDRPLRVATLVSTVRSALRARRRQYQIRSHMAALQQASRELAASEQRYRAIGETIRYGV